MDQQTLWRRLAHLRKLAQLGDFEALATYTDNRSPALRARALQTLIQYHFDGLPELLVKGLVDDDERNRALCRETLQLHAATAVPALVAGLRDPRRGPLCAALLASTREGRGVLAQIPGAVERLLAVVRDPSQPALLRAHALAFVETLRGEAIDDALGDCLEDREQQVREAATAALLRRDTPEGDDRLLDWADRHWEQATRLIGWLGAHPDRRSRAALGRMCGWAGLLVVPLRRRAEARAALARMEHHHAEASDAALSRVTRPAAVSTRALSSSDSPVDRARD